MPDDHTAGVGTGDPYPVAEVADNDLAVGRIIDTISHSKFWKNSAVFVVEDDTQNGVDHVDGHRAPLLIAIALRQARRRQQRLLHPAQRGEDDRADPRHRPDEPGRPGRRADVDAFTNTPNFTPYTVVPNQIPLTEGLTAATAPQTPATTPARPVADAETPRAGRALVPAAPVAGPAAVYAQWVVWSRNGRFNGNNAIQDFANPAQLNRLDWYSAHNWKVPYPGDKAILAPARCPGPTCPADYLGD